jgi:hypothetical protein
MFCQAGFDPWLRTIMQHLPQLSKPQATVLAWGSFGMVRARSCALTALSHLLAQGMHRKEQTVRQQWRAGYDEVPRKRGTRRQALPVATCVPGLLGWGVRGWHGTPLALALEATALGTRVVGWAVRVVARGCALPVAWVVLPAHTKQAGRRAWRRLLRRLGPALPRGWRGRVWAERGGAAPWRWRRLTRQGWPPFVRLNMGGSFRPPGAPCGRPVTRWAPQPGPSGRGPGLALTRPQGAGPLLARGEAGDKAPWLIRTALAPEARDAGWYGLRAWIAQGVKSTPRAGWQGPRTRRPAPDRAARRWVAVAVATLWLRSGGGEADETMPPHTLLEVTAWCPEHLRTRRPTDAIRTSIGQAGSQNEQVASAADGVEQGQEARRLRHKLLDDGGPLGHY